MRAANLFFWRGCCIQYVGLTGERFANNGFCQGEVVWFLLGSLGVFLLRARYLPYGVVEAVGVVIHRVGDVLDEDQPVTPVVARVAARVAGRRARAAL